MEVLKLGIEKMLCTLGRFDIPIIQLQPPFVVDLLDSNIALFGAAMSGKTTFIRTLINILHKQYDEKQEQIFILDFGGALFECKDLPLVSAYFDNSNEEYVKRVFKILDNILRDNIKELNGKNYRDSEVQPPHTTFIIDNINAFIDEPRYTAYQEKLAKLCREGLSKGITIVITALDTKGVIPYLGSFKQKIAFEMPMDKYSEIFNGKVSLIGNNPGHGFANVTVKPEGITGTFRMNLPYEVQCFFPYKPKNADGAGDTEESFAEKIKEKFNFSEGKYLKCVKKYWTFPKELTREEYERLKQTPKNESKEYKLPVSVGLDYVNFYPVTVDLEQSRVIAIYGKKEFGKTNLLNLLLSGFAQQKQEAEIVFFDDGRNQLEPIYNNLKDKLNCKLINKFEEIELRFTDDSKKTRKLSPLQQFYVYLNEKHISLDKPNYMADIYGVSKISSKEYLTIPDCYVERAPFTVFVIQSKLVYLNANENKRFINTILPQLVSVAEERGYLFIFSDVQKIGDAEQNSFFNNTITTAFLLDNIAEFAGERGQKTIFGNMDIKSLKEDYARCEIGDGYYYDVEADNLLKLKFIKY
ncbi:DNA segregation ATPase, FtsK/SpoIIIE family [Acetivibrio clariflavus DSM 19732]|uniref:DNA segregation ATPase, FtsK/SpoIIIE family n=1 Tax=Acetivibrio clariflavus (strain DSM 19732 / NBRC 101661 / EBR45) TaxID=720554 RepID=G8LVY0_ACECE|nr:DNA segregation ATPase, FtsK/SpoIIIE family [Acetivibrio clariflavus DSM 19732]